MKLGEVNSLSPVSYEEEENWNPRMFSPKPTHLSYLNTLTFKSLSNLLVFSDRLSRFYSEEALVQFASIIFAA